MPALLPKPYLPWLMLFSRPALFILIQCLIAGLFALTGRQDAWDEAPRWWTITAALANIASIYLLVRVFRAEGCRYRDLFRFQRATVKKDLLWLLGSSVIGLPVISLPMGNLAVLLFGNSMTPVEMLFRPLPAWGLAAAFLFPLTIAFAELPTYFGYVMPRLARQPRLSGQPQLAAPWKSGWAAWLVASFVLGAQHMFLPFIPDGRFLLWRLGMYMPFALFAGLVIKLRPQMLPYLLIIHALADFSAVAVYFMV